jgi:hypothetical protein
MLSVVSVGASSDMFVANLMTLSLAKLSSNWCRMASEKDVQESGLDEVVHDRDKWWNVVNIVLSLQDVVNIVLSLQGVVNIVLSLQAPKSSWNSLTNKGTINFSRPMLIDLKQGSHSAPISGTVMICSNL